MGMAALEGLGVCWEVEEEEEEDEGEGSSGWKLSGNLCSKGADHEVRTTEVSGGCGFNTSRYAACLAHQFGLFQ